MPILGAPFKENEELTAEIRKCDKLRAHHREAVEFFKTFDNRPVNNRTTSLAVKLNDELLVCEQQWSR